MHGPLPKVLSSFFISARQEEETVAGMCTNAPRKVLLQWMAAIPASQSPFATTSMHIPSRTMHIHIQVSIYVQMNTYFLYTHIQKTHICSIIKRILKMQRVIELCQTEVTPLPCSSALQPPLRTEMLGCCHTTATLEVLAVPAPMCPYSCRRAAISLPRVNLDQCPGHWGRDVRCRAAQRSPVLAGWPCRGGCG